MWRITTGSRIQVESNFSENKCIVIFLTYLLILEQLLIEKRPLEHYKLEEKQTISSVDQLNPVCKFGAIPF